jgi:hypothetical protein
VYGLDSDTDTDTDTDTETVERERESHVIVDNPTDPIINPWYIACRSISIPSFVYISSILGTAVAMDRRSGDSCCATCREQDIDLLVDGHHLYVA